MNKIRLLLLGLLLLTILATIFIKIYTAQDNKGKAKPGGNKWSSSTLPVKTQDTSQQDPQLKNEQIASQITRYKDIQKFISFRYKKDIIPESPEGAREIISILKQGDHASRLIDKLLLERFKSPHFSPLLIEFYNSKKEDLEDTEKRFILYLIGVQADQQVKSFLLNIFRTSDMYKSSKEELEQARAFEALYILTMENRELISTDRSLLSEMINNVGNSDTISVMCQLSMIGILCASGVDDIINSLKNRFWKELNTHEIPTSRGSGRGMIPVFDIISRGLLFHDAGFAEELYEGFKSSDTNAQVKILLCIRPAGSGIINRLYKDEDILKKQWAPLSDLVVVALESSSDEIRESACSKLSSYQFLITSKIIDQLKYMKANDPNKRIRKQCSKILDEMEM